MTVLVTGVAGFIGYHVADRIMARGDRVIGIDSVNGYYDPRLKEARIDRLQSLHGSRFHFHRLDFADDALLDEALAAHAFDRIVHFGAQAGVRYSLDNPRAYARSNLTGHLNILELARHRKVRHLVYASSSSVYGGNTSLPFRIEDRVDHPVSLYAATKKADELMSESYSHLYRIPMTGLRFFTVYGPWGRPDMAVWIFTENILANKPIQLFNNAAMRRDFTYIDDVVTGAIAALDSPPVDDGTIKAGGSHAPHRLYNIGNHRSEELSRVVSILEEACGRAAEVQLMPMQPGDVQDTFADISAISGELGFKPTTAIEEGLPRFVKWFKTRDNFPSLHLRDDSRAASL